MPTSEKATLFADGFAIHRGVFSSGEIEDFREAIAAVLVDEPVKPYGVRNLSDRCREVAKLPRHRRICCIIDGAIGEPWCLVRSIFFDKVPGANWHVGWHQDLSIAVRERSEFEVPGFSGWTVKDGVQHVQAPAELLNRMVTVRIHLDDAESKNGPLRVIPGSHRERLDSKQIQARIETGPQIECVASAGDVVVMRPLLLHASHKAEPPRHRRIIHLEFAPVDGLPGGLNWFRE